MNDLEFTPQFLEDLMENADPADYLKLQWILVEKVKCVYLIH